MFCTSRTSSRPLAHLEQRIEAGRQGVGRIEQQAVREFGAPAGGELPVLTLHVVDDGGMSPREQGRHDQANALAGAGGCHGQHMLGTVVAQIAAAIESEHDALLGQQTGVLHVGSVRPASRAIGDVLALMAGPPGGSPDGDETAGETPERGNGACACKHVRRLRVERQPPDEQLPGRVELDPKEIDPRGPQRRLVAQHGGGPLRGGGQARHHQSDGDQTLRERDYGARAWTRAPFEREKHRRKRCPENNGAINWVNRAGL